MPHPLVQVRVVFRYQQTGHLGKLRSMLPESSVEISHAVSNLRAGLLGWQLVDAGWCFRVRELSRSENVRSKVFGALEHSADRRC